MAAVEDSAGTLIRHTAGTDGARPEHGTLAHREYRLLAPTGTAVNPSDAGDRGSKYGHDTTRGAANQAWRETEEGGDTRQSALPARGMQGVDDE